MTDNKILEKIMKDRENFKQSEKSNVRKNRTERIQDIIALICMIILIGFMFVGCYVLV